MSRLFETQEVLRECLGKWGLFEIGHFGWYDEICSHTYIAESYVDKQFNRWHELEEHPKRGKTDNQTHGNKIAATPIGVVEISHIPSSLCLRQNPSLPGSKYHSQGKLSGRMLLVICGGGLRMVKWEDIIAN